MGRKRYSRVLGRGSFFGTRTGPGPLVSTAILRAPSLYTKLTFQDNWTLTANGTSNHHEYVYNLSSLYDPYYGVGGGTIEGYTVLTGIWDHYIVNGVKAKIKYVIAGGSAAQILSSFLYAESYATKSAAYGVPTYDQMFEQKQGLATLKPRFNDISPNTRYDTLQRYYSLNKIEQTTRSHNNEQYTAVTNANPTKYTVLNIGMISQNDTFISDGTRMVVTMTLTYYAKLFNRIPNLN